MMGTGLLKGSDLLCVGTPVETDSSGDIYPDKSLATLDALHQPLAKP